MRVTNVSEPPLHFSLAGKILRCTASGTSMGSIVRLGRTFSEQTGQKLRVRSWGFSCGSWTQTPASGTDAAAPPWWPWSGMQRSVWEEMCWGVVETSDRPPPKSPSEGEVLWAPGFHTCASGRQKRSNGQSCPGTKGRKEWFGNYLALENCSFKLFLSLVFSVNLVREKYFFVTKTLLVASMDRLALALERLDQNKWFPNLTKRALF